MRRIKRLQCYKKLACDVNICPFSIIKNFIAMAPRWKRNLQFLLNGRSHKFVSLNLSIISKESEWVLDWCQMTSMSLFRGFTKLQNFFHFFFYFFLISFFLPPYLLSLFLLYTYITRTVISNGIVLLFSIKNFSRSCVTGRKRGARSSAK